MKISSVSRTLCVIAAFFVTAWWLYPHIAESAHTRSETTELQPLAPPLGFTAANANDDTAFPEEKAGFSAYYRVGGSDGGESEPRLNVKSIADALTSDPGESEIRKAGNLNELGLNFGIVELPMYAAFVSPRPIENVTVYFDDQGWIVAYLPTGKPAAAIWKYKSVGDTTGNAELANNLLVLAINEVLKANDASAAEVGHSAVAYYDWENADCDAFVLFSAVANGGASAPVKFVIPRTIKGIQASAAAVIASDLDGGNTANWARVRVDENEVRATAPNLLAVSSIVLEREYDEDNTLKTSLHQMTVEVSEGESAAGVVMLLYDKP